MIKRVLVAIDGSPGGELGVKYAVELAKQHAATLVGLHVIDIRLLEGPFVRDVYSTLGATSFASYQGDVARILTERAIEVLARFEERCTEANVSQESKHETGLVWKIIVDNSSLADMIVLGRQGEHGAFLDGLLGSTTEAVVRRARTPVLVTDRDYCRIRTFVVAYDGSDHARAALQIGAAIGEEWGIPFSVLSIGNSAEAKLDEARQYLAAHNFEGDFIAVPGDPGDVLIEFARERDSDLIIMGAFGHSKVRELLVGSITAHTLNHAPCAVLLAR